MTLREVVRGIDWGLLRRQKAWLAAQVSVADTDAPEGLLGLLDAVQDAAVEEGIVSERTVFGSGRD